jgi:outer membrane protein TolC
VYALSRRTVRRDLEIATANLESGERRVEALGVRLASAREAFAQAEGLYDAGLATNLERLTAQDDALRTELALQQAELDRVVLRFDLLRATGEIAEWLGVRRELGGGDAAPR